MQHSHDGFATQCIHAGVEPDPQTGAIMTPVYMTSTYVQSSPGIHKGYEYSRTHNPTRDALQHNLAELESGKYGFAFSSGCAATSCVLMCLSAGDHIIAGDDLYGGTRRLMAKVFNRLGIETTFVDLTDPSDLDAVIQKNTKLVWIETPTNPMLKLIDIQAIAQKTKAAGLILAVDNTFATPYLQRPLELGADLVIHSTTKYLGGHSDVVGGAVITRDQALAEQLAFIQNAVGAVPGPMDCFLVLRGIKTLAVRMEKHCANALKIKDFLENHSQVERVYYPQGDLVKKQMKHPGAMMSFVIKGGLDAAQHFIESLRLFKCAESLGGVESLVGLPAMMTHASIPLEIRKNLGIEDGLIRLSVGIEDPIDLLKDLRDGFSPN